MKELTLRCTQGPVDWDVRLPGSKSLTNRALLAAALARGESRLDHVLFADDSQIMMDALQALGVELRIQRSRSRVMVHGCGGYWPESEAVIFCGNAGTVMRFLTAVCCVGQGAYRLDGSPRMRERPIGALVDALRDLGAAIAYEAEDGFCPLSISARSLRGGQTCVSSPSSSQYVSGLLMAGALASADVFIEVQGELPSRPYVAMTLQVMADFGVSAVEDAGARFIVPGRQTYRAAAYQVEPDASAASYFFGAAAVTGGRVTVKGLGSRSVQGDVRFVDVLRAMGCRVDQAAESTTVWGPAGGRLQGVDVDLNDMPDVAPTLAVLAAFAEGPTRIRNVANLRIKESDRLHALTTELGHLGVETELHQDGITVRPPGRVVPGRVNTYDDHRIAMSFALAGLRVDGVVIRDPECVKKTFPEFFEVWAGKVES